MAGDFYSDPIKVSLCKSHNLSLFFDGAPVGTFTLEHSCDLTNRAEDISSTSWLPVPNSSADISGAGGHLYMNAFKAKWVRVKYTRTSGNGNCDGTVFGVEEY
jgi:hypothetical protein